jgi:alpha-beta hydrolase superfamily lysophospholipase
VAHSIETTGKRRKWGRNVFIGSFVLAAILLVNAIAFIQAWSMTHFVVGSSRTEPPEKLSLIQKFEVLATGVRIPRPVNLLTPSDFHMAFQTLHLQANGVDLEIWFIPAAENPHGLVLMYHAYTSSKSSVLPAAVQFHQMGYNIQMIDFRGSGGSSGNSTTVGYREADDVVATASDARQHFPHVPLVLYGQSMGAAAVLRAVGDLGVSPNLIIIESPYDRLLSTVNNRFTAMHLPAFPLARILLFWGGTQQGYWGFGMNPAESATRVRCPALMFHGAWDPRVTADQARSVYNNLAGPKQLEWYDQGGHCAFLSGDPARWKKSVSDMLKRYATAEGL